MVDSQKSIRSTSAFTLVELVVVIVILAILATIGFLSVKNYSSNARDSQRVADVTQLAKSLDYAIVSAGSYPAPDNSLTMSYSGAPVWYQWTAGNGMINQLIGMGKGSINRKPVDPLRSTDYRYSVLAFGKAAYSLAADYEGDLVAANPFVDAAYADVGNPKVSYLKSNYNGLVAKTVAGSTTYVLAIPTIAAAATAGADVTALSGTYLLHNQSNSGTVFVSAVVFSGSALPTSDSGSLITNMMANLKAAYSGAVSAVTVQQPVASLLSTPAWSASVSLGTTLITTYLGGSATSVSAGGWSNGFTCTGATPSIGAAGLTYSTTAPSNNSTSWSYSGSTSSNGPACTWKCDPTYTQNGNTCSPQAYVDDVFATNLYAWNSSSQTITNGIDLAGQGGMVWGKSRNNAGWPLDFGLFDSVRWIGNLLYSSNTNAQWAGGSAIASSLSGNGFVLGSNAQLNRSGDAYVSWTFRKAPKFFDVVTYTGNGTTKTLSHSLSQSVGMLVIKRTDNTGDWLVWHKSGGAGNRFYLNQTLAVNTGSSETFFGNNTSYVDPTSTQFTVGNSVTVNANGASYVAYLFADDPDATNGIIQAGSFTTDASGNASVNLGWEPQFVLTKGASGASPTGNWLVQDSSRWMTANGSSAFLYANSSSAENAWTSYNGVHPNATGFTTDTNNFNGNTTYVYLAIRRPNKPPTSGTQVYNAVTYTGNDTDDRAITGVWFAPDMALIAGKSDNASWPMPLIHTRLTGRASMATNSTNGEGTSASSTAQGLFVQDWVTAGRFGTWWFTNYSGQSGGFVAEFFKRAPGAFDIVTYTGDGTTPRSIPHNLGVPPEMIWLKSRNWAVQWFVYHAGYWTSGQPYALSINDPTIGNWGWFPSAPTSSTFFVSHPNTNTNNASYNQYIAYLFASKQDVSKVGSYTGSNSQQDITYGYSNAPRFLLIKRTDAVGSWYLYDSARGLTSGSSPYIKLDATSGQTASTDVEAITGWFRVKTSASSTINVPGASYIYLAIH